MCGRLVRTSPAELLRAEFSIARFTTGDLRPRYNICPGEDILAIVSDGEERRLGTLRWGLVPPGGTASQRSRPLINARAETLHSRPSFREAFRRRRCLIVADGFYEWRPEGGGKTPYFIHLRSGRPFALAGIWERSPEPGGSSVAACAIVTCAPNPLVARLHDRMPVILSRDDQTVWLDPRREKPEPPLALLDPYPAGEMEAWPVSNLVNSPRNDGPDCIAPLAEAIP